jgi:flagellin-like hook-associated protein FlgL
VFGRTGGIFVRCSAEVAAGRRMPPSTSASPGAVATTAGGTAEVLVGRDVNPNETRGIFNTLIRLNEALLNDDILEISRLTGLLDEDISRLSFARGELGARDQHLDVLKQRSDEEILQLRSTLSLEIEIDMVQAISDLTAHQAAFEASLQIMGQLHRLTLLDFI